MRSKPSWSLCTIEFFFVLFQDVPNYGYAPGPLEVAYPDIPYAPGYGYDTGYLDTDK